MKNSIKKSLSQTPTTKPTTHTGALHKSVGFPGFSLNKLKTTSMKNSIILLLIVVTSLIACNPPAPTEQQKQQQPLTAQTAPAETSKTSQTVRLIFLADRSGSFIKQYTHPDPALFKPLCDKICSKGNTLDFRYGVIREYSDIVFDRYFVPFTPKTVEQESSNPWLASEGGTPEPPKQKATDWNSFAENVNSKLAASPSQASDVANAISRAVVSCQEQGENVRSILFLCTDGADTYRQLPTIPQSIEVITVGISPDNRIEQTLNTSNIKRFENLQAAIDYLISQQF